MDIQGSDSLNWPSAQSTPVLSSLSVLGLVPTPTLFGHGAPSALTNHYIPVVCLPLLLTALLYTGPLYTCALDGCLPLQRNFSFRADVVDRFTRLAGVRTYLVVRGSTLASSYVNQLTNDSGSPSLPRGL